MMEVPLTQGRVALIDEADAPLVMDRKWHARRATCGSWYARHATKSGIETYMHRLIVAAPPRSHVEHRNGNTLDNTRTNLNVALGAGTGARLVPWQERFWDKVQKSDGCWLWTAARNKSGYGRLGGVGMRTQLAHRLSWELAHGPIGENLLVCHRCDTPPCVRPDHLFLGTDADNHDDMDRKGRGSVVGLALGRATGLVKPGQFGDNHWTKRKPESVRRGDRHPAAKLRSDDVALIRSRHSAGEPRAGLAIAFGVSLATVHLIIQGKIWRSA